MKRTVLAVVLVLVLAVTAGLVGVAWLSGLLPWVAPQDSSAPTEAKDQVVAFIKTAYPNAAIPQATLWSGERLTPEELVGHETYVYRSGDWRMLVDWNVVAEEDVTYQVQVRNGAIAWICEVKGGKVTELYYGEVDQEGIEVILTAVSFIRASPTFSWDGIDDSIHVSTLRYEPPCEWCGKQQSGALWIVQLTFTCNHGGYGNRTGQVPAQAITKHVADITIIEDGRVASAIIDGVWNEFHQTWILNGSRESSESVACSVTNRVREPTLLPEIRCIF